VAGSAAVNSLIAGGKPDAGASFGSTHDVVRIRHREYISDLYTGPTAGVFSNNTLSVNPGLSTTFPYLAPIAANFEEYRFRGLVFEFVSSTSPYLAGGAMGTLVAAMQYNPLAEPFSNKPQMENSDYAVSSRFDTNLMYGVECKEFTQNSYLVRYSDSAPLTAYDVGTFQFATAPGSTFPVNSTIGELWVSYDIELMRPRISQARFGIGHLRYTTALPNAQNVMPVPEFLSAMGVISQLSVGNYTVGYPAATNNLVTISGLSTGDIISVVLAAKGAAFSTTAATSFYGLSGLTEFRCLAGNTHHQFQTTGDGAPVSISYWQVTAPPGTPCTFYINSVAIVSADLIIEAMGNGLQASTT